MTIPARHVLSGALLATALLHVPSALADPVIKRLTPPSALFSFGDKKPPIIARFLEGQRFDLQTTVSPDPGQTIKSVKFFVDDVQLQKNVTFVHNGLLATLPLESVVATVRAYSNKTPGTHILKVEATQSDSKVVTATGNFEVVALPNGARKAKNIIFCIGDGMGIAHRTAARLVSEGVQMGKSNGPLAMDRMPVTGIVNTHSLNSIVTDSSPGAACYSTGNKGNNNQHGVFPDDTIAVFDNPRIENIGEFLSRLQGRSLGIVTTSDVFDATPGSFGSHTSNRGAGTGICDQYLDESGSSGLKVLMGGGRKWFLPAGTTGSARADASDYILPDSLSKSWKVPAGAIDSTRDLIADFKTAGFSYASSATQLSAIPASTDKLLGLFAFSNMNVAKDKIDGRRGTSKLVNDYGFPDQPMLPEMAEKALQVLSKDADGFVLMIEGASIDKQAHNMDSERWILDTIEFDAAVHKCLEFADSRDDTLIIVTADHECAGVNIIGASKLTNNDLKSSVEIGGGISLLRGPVVGTYDAAGFPQYQIMKDGFPRTMDVDYKILIGYAANADRMEDWLTNKKPLKDSQQPLIGVPPLSTYPALPVNQDPSGFLITGQIADTSAAHTASDIPLSASGVGALYFTGVMDNTSVFFKAMEAAFGGVPTPAEKATLTGP